MSNTVENILKGVVEMSIRQPNDALAQWSTVHQFAGSRSVKLSKGGTGNAGSTHVEISGSGLTDRAITMTAWTAGIITNSFYFKTLDTTVGNYCQMEFKFEDPDSDAWVEITAVPLQGHTGDPIWVKQTLADADLSGIGGRDELDDSFFDWAIAALNGQQAAIEALTDGGDCANWILSRVRVELWEASPERGCYIDSIEIMGTTYTVEPGGTAPGLRLSSPYVHVGYTEDGVNIEPSVELNFIRVDEEVYPVDAAIASGAIKITCNMAEASLANLNAALAGSALSGNILTLGAGVLQKISLRLEGLTPAGYIRSYEFPKVVASGAVGMSYTRTGKTIVPVTFEVLKPDGEPAGTWVDNAA